MKKLLIIVFLLILAVSCRSTKYVLPVEYAETEEFKIVKKQIKAYNDYDLEKLVSCFHDDAEVRWLPDMSEEMKGIEEIRERYSKTFKKFKALSYEIKDTIIEKNVIVILGSLSVNDRPAKPYVANYYVVDGKIIRIFIWPGLGK